jgi:hypothetical protein
MPLSEKDSYQFQRARVGRIAGELVPDGTVGFDEPSTFIRFVIRKMGTNVTESSGDCLPSQLAQQSDDWLRGFIVGLSSGRIKLN